MKANDVIKCLKVRFSVPEYAFLEQVADGTGARQNRWADAVAMSVWPSRGYDLHGIEVKVSRYDWLNELKQPEKSIAVQQYMNRWWIATPDDTLIKPGELPTTWGWMCCKGSTMRVVTTAPLLIPKPLSVEFVASVLRNFGKADESAVEAVRRAAYQSGRDDGGEYYQKEYKSIKNKCEEFEKASGLRIDRYDGGKDMGDAVRTLQNLKWRVNEIAGAVKACDAIKSMLEKVQLLEDLEKDVIEAQK